MNPLKELSRFGVSVWYDNISRGLLSSGELSRMIEADGLSGVTSNPTIFEKAIGSSLDYDEPIRRLAQQGKSAQEIFETLSIEDIRAAADLFAPLHRDSRGRDGFVSIELPPALARDASASHREALRLHHLIGRPNVMIKIPGTAEGVRAFEEATADGVPVNVTLIFSQERYQEVVWAYLKGLERRAAHNKDLSKLASVASFFISRIDTAVDGKLKARSGDSASLLGKAAIANAKLAYQIFKREFSSARFAALKRLGAGPQRLLWASTGAKNPEYRDVLYVEELIGPDTVNTMPPATLEAFRRHGACRPSLEEDLAGARGNLEDLKALGLDLDATLRRLEDEGVESFARSYETLLGQIAAKKEMIQAEAGVVEAGIAELLKAQFSTRLWRKDPSLWKQERAHQKIIRDSLGWLELPEASAAGLAPLRAFAAEIRKEGFERAVVLGMGGSSLSCEVFRSCFSPAKGFPILEVLDTTNPGAVSALESRSNLKRTLFIVSSKSGSTIEPNCLMQHFLDRVSRAGGKASIQFVAITDPGTSLEKLARKFAFRRVFTSPPEVGGRYSALTVFGLLPAALMGVDVERLLERAREAHGNISPATATGENPALRLGAALGRHALRGQDKLTLCPSPAIETFGLWASQLVAESTGKEGRGIVPVCGEPLGPAASYGGDRLFVRLALADSPDHEAEERLLALERAGHPVLTFKLRDLYDLGAQFFIWEVATAAAGFLLGVNPFDQPDVQAAKEKTEELLGSLKKGSLPHEMPALRAGGLAAYCDKQLLKSLGGGSKAQPQLPLREALGAHLARLGSGDYVAVLAFVNPSPDNRLALDALQRRLRELTTAPVCVEYGPRYLHSTGQLYKGGPDRGLFLQLVEPEARPLKVPGKPFSFGLLHGAQARGDFEAMIAAGRRILRLELGPAGAGSLAAVSNALSELPQRRSHATESPAP